MKFTISLKDAIEYSWQIIIIVIVHEYTHNAYIYITNRQFVIGNYGFLCSIGRTCCNSDKFFFCNTVIILD